jgi:hypothetical protein
LVAFFTAFGIAFFAAFLVAFFAAFGVAFGAIFFAVAVVPAVVFRLRARGRLFGAGSFDGTSFARLIRNFRGVLSSK